MVINFALFCLSIWDILNADVICVSDARVIVILLLKEAIVVQGLTVQKLTIVYKKPLPVNVISFYRIDILLELL